MAEVCAEDERAILGRRSRVGLTPRRWRQIGEILSPMTGARKPDPRGEHEGNRKTIAQGRPDRSGEPVVTNLRVFYTTREAAGGLTRPAFPAPSVFEGHEFHNARAFSRRGKADVRPGEMSTQKRSSCPDLIRASIMFHKSICEERWMAGS